MDWEGPVTIEAYTVAHQRGRARIAHAACLTDNGTRTWATVQDSSVLEAMMREEFCGRSGRVDGHGQFSMC